VILDFFHTDSEVTRRDLLHINSLISSDIFLKGLGKDAKTIVISTEFPIICDIVYAQKIMTSQDIWDMPEPWPYQYFPGVIEDGIEHSKHATYEQRVELRKIISKNSDLFGQFLWEVIQEKYRKHNINEYLAATVKSKKYEYEFLEFIVNNSFKNDIHGYISYLIDAAYYGGISASPIFQRVYTAFMTGGIPCGWVGPLPENGGDPKLCMQLLHFGRKS
jgi:hypothetical protein